MAPAQPGGHRRAVDFLTRHRSRVEGAPGMINDNKMPSRGMGRRKFLSACAGMSAAALLPGSRVFAADGAEGLRIQRLAWAGIRLQLPQATLFIDPLVNPDAWGPALKDPLIPVGDAVGDTYVLITHAHPDHFDAKAAADALAKGGALVYPAGTNPLPIPQGARA